GSILTYQSIEAFRELARSPNAKVIVTDGKAPFLLTDEVTAPTITTEAANTSSSGASSAVQRLVRPASSTPRP
nr:hypothetical protein [Gemmatimonadaceae bacterium]